MLGHKNLNRPICRSRQRARRNRRIAARSNRQVWSFTFVSPRCSPDMLDAYQMQQLRKNMSCFLRTSDIVRLVFYPDSALLTKSQGIAQCVITQERRSSKTHASDLCHLVIKILNNFRARFKVKTQSCSKRIPRQIPLKSNERIRVAVAP